MLYNTQWTHRTFGAAGSGASGSSTISARLMALSGTPDHSSGGELSSPSQVYFAGIAPPAENAEDVSVSAMSNLRRSVISRPTSAWHASASARPWDGACSLPAAQYDVEPSAPAVSHREHRERRGDPARALRANARCTRRRGDDPMKVTDERIVAVETADTT